MPTFDADDAELSLLAVLMLRGTQTPGELKQRTERLHGFADLAAVQETLEKLVERDYVERLPRRPGQKEERFAHLLGERAEPDHRPAGAEGEAEIERRGPEDRVDRVERELAELRAQVRELREALGEPAEGV